MGKVKEQLLNHIYYLDDEVLEKELSMRYQDETEYQEWLESTAFVDFVNEQIDLTKPRYSYQDILNAIQYASKSITLNPSEVGKETYETLFSEKIEEYINSNLQ